MDQMKEFDRILLAKERRRGELAKLSYEEKVRIVVRLQEMQAPILLSRGVVVKPWHLG